jgi:hypothetical protein
MRIFGQILALVFVLCVKAKQMTMIMMMKTKESEKGRETSMRERKRFGNVRIMNRVLLR